MLKNAHTFRYILAPVFLLVFLCFSVTPVAFAASHSLGPGLVGPKKLYLALGDSLAFGYQPNLNWNHGYVDDFFNNLKGHGTKHVANMGCLAKRAIPSSIEDDPNRIGVSFVLSVRNWRPRWL